MAVIGLHTKEGEDFNMDFVNLLLFAVYCSVLFYFASHSRKNLAKVKEKKDSLIGENIILEASFSNKWLYYSVIMLVFSAILGEFVFVVSNVGIEEFSSFLSIDETLLKFLCIFAFCFFIYFAIFGVFYFNLYTNSVNQFLFVTNDKVFGGVCVTKGFKFQSHCFEIKISDITHIITSGTKDNRTNSPGFYLPYNFTIVTNTEKYEYALILDGDEIRRIINEQKNLQSSVI